jgi:hypothetical protein
MRSNRIKRSLVLAISFGITLTMMPPFASAGSSKHPAAAPLSNEVVLEWNQQAVGLTLGTLPALAPVEQTRVMAIFQLAVHDAVNGITGEYETYLSPTRAPANASPLAAAIAAAHHSLKTLFQGNDDALNARFLNSLAANDLQLTDPGIEYGRAAAAAILSLRAGDHSSEARFAYDAPGVGNPGVWVRPTGVAALLPGWGSVTPFVMRSGSQFRPGPPPALDSDLYARDYNEVKEIGQNVSSTRSTDQSNIARFWRASPTAIWNPVLVQVVQSRNLELSKTAQVFALFYLAAADASIACWEAKYTYNFWRPETAIRNGDSDFNNVTIGNATWSPFVPTPPHPEYPSGHTANSGAMATILGLTFDNEPGTTLVVTLSGVTRSWTSFSEAVEEVIDARVYSGIHFRNSDEVGARMGFQVAKFVSTHALRRSRGNH